MQNQQKKECAVVLGVSKGLEFAAASVIFDLQNKSPNLATEIILQHDGIARRHIKILSSIPNIRFVKYKLPKSARKRVSKKTLCRFTELVFSKYECLKYLDEFRSVIWLDIDQVIQRDISDLKDYSSTGIKMIPSQSDVQQALWHPIVEYDMKAPSICASVFVFQEHIGDHQKMHKWCYKMVEKYGPSLVHEQPIFDILRQQFNLVIEPLDTDIYCCHPNMKDKVDSAKVVHAYGQPKFWNGIENIQWNENIAKWKSMGGISFLKIRKNFLLAIRDVIWNILKKFKRFVKNR